MIRNPFACLGLCFTATLFVLNLLPDFTPVVLATTAICLGLCLALRRLPERGKAAMILLGVAAAAALFTAAQKTAWEPALALDRHTGVFHAAATGETSTNEEKQRFFSVVRTEQGQKLVLVTDRDYDLKPGDRVTFYGKVYAEQPWLNRAGRVFLICWYPKDLVVERAERNRLRDWPYAARRFLIERITGRVGGDEGTVAAAMATGVKDELADETYGAFKSAGLTHVIAVSGLHMNLIVLALYRLLWRRLRIRQRVSAAICLAAAWAYAAVAAFTPSAVRACIMISAFLGAVLFRRRVSPLNSLGLAAFLILLVNPYAVCSASFELSFAATLALLTVGRRLLAFDPFEKLPLRLPRKALRAVYAALAVTFSANVGCLPVFLFLGIDATYACFVSNLTAFFAVAPALISALFTALPGVCGQLSAGACRLCAGYILLVAQKVGSVNWLPLLSWPSAVLAAVSAAAFWLLHRRKKQKNKQ